jgi:hypothetical protein
MHNYQPAEELASRLKVSPGMLHRAGKHGTAVNGYLIDRTPVTAARRERDPTTCKLQYVYRVARDRQGRVIRRGLVAAHGEGIETTDDPTPESMSGHPDDEVTPSRRLPIAEIIEQVREDAPPQPLETVLDRVVGRVMQIRQTAERKLAADIEDLTERVETLHAIQLNAEERWLLHTAPEPVRDLRDSMPSELWALVHNLCTVPPNEINAVAAAQAATVRYIFNAIMARPEEDPHGTD